jgi:hypothetical protein
MVSVVEVLLGSAIVVPESETVHPVKRYPVLTVVEMSQVRPCITLVPDEMLLPQRVTVMLPAPERLVV